MRNMNIVINRETLAELLTFKIGELKISPDEYETIPNDEFRENLTPTGKLCPRCKANELKEISVVIGKRIKDFNTLAPQDILSHLALNSRPQFERNTIKIIPIVFNCHNCIYYEPIQGWDKFMKQEDKLRKEIESENR